MVHNQAMRIHHMKTDAGLMLRVISLLALTNALIAGNWPQFLGPQRDGVASDESDIPDWQNNSQKRVWNLDVGSGFSGPVIHEEKLFLYHRKNNKSIFECFNVKSGKTIWKYQHATSYRDDFGFDNGPRATPCIHEDTAYLMSADGILSSIRTSDGKLRWEINAREKWNTEKGFFGRASSPVVFGDLVFFIIGGKPNAGVIALERSSGKLKWSATSDPAGYSSPVIEQNNRQNILWAWTRESIHGLEAITGDLLYTYPFRSRMNASVNAATPLILPEGLFLSASYGVGGILLNKESETLKTVWSGDQQISNHYATSVYHEGHLYGYHGRQEFGPEFRCVEASSGKVRWKSEGLGAGSVLRVNERLLLMLESGELILASANPDKFQIFGRKQILPSGVRAFPAYSRGLFVARSPDQMVCWKLAPTP